MKKMLPVLFLVATSLSFAQNSAATKLTNVSLLYDDAHRISAINGPDGHKTVLSYDRQSRLTVLKTDDQTDTIQYDVVGNIAALSDATGKTSFTYTPWGNLKTMHYPMGDTVSYEYDTSSRIMHVSWGDVNVLQYSRDLMGHIVSIKTPVGIVSFQYDYDSRMLRRLYPNGASSFFMYNNEGRPLVIQHVTPENKVFMELDYTYDDAGRLAVSVEKTRTTQITATYTYDKYGELTGADYSDGRSYRYVYDRSGNLIQSTEGNGFSAVYDERDRLVSINNEPARHDGFGNIVALGDRQIVFDARGRLTSDRDRRFAYDALGLRVSEKTEKEERRFVHLLGDRPYLLGETGSRTVFYLQADGRVLGQAEKGGRALFFFEDQLGSLRAAMDAAGNIVGTADYTPFGLPITRIPGVSIGFAGEEQDENGLVYLRARYYAPQLGRFLSRDQMPPRPIDESKQNGYAYAGNNPLNQIDPDGTDNFGIDLANDWWKYSPIVSFSFPNNNFMFLCYISTLFSVPIIGPGETIPSFSSILPIANDFIAEAMPLIINPSTNTTQTVLVNILNSQPIIAAAFCKVEALEKASVLAFHIASQLPIIQNYVNPNSAAISMNDNKFSNVSSSSPSYFGTDYKMLADSIASDAYRLPSNDAADVQYARVQNALVVLSESPLPSYSMGTLTDVLLNASYTSATDLSRSMRGVEDNGIVFRPDSFTPPSSSGASGTTANASTGLPPPDIGGVYLTKAAEVIGGLYGLEGAVVDKATGRLVLIGKDKEHQVLPALNIENLATAFRAVFGTNSYEPGVSIDPDPTNPKGKEMLVRFLGGVENTSFGQTLFEADRVMKSISLGQDSLTHAKMSVNVDGFHNMTALIFSNLSQKRDPNLWSRFWLIPEEVIVQVSADGNSISFPDTRIRVKTETMRWQNGQLISAGSVKDECAEYFADHFTRHYDEYAKQYPIFQEIKNCANMVALAKWLKEKNVDFSLDWLKVYDRFQKTPEKTPSLSITETRNSSDGQRTAVVSAFLIGGTDLSVENRYVQDDGTAAASGRAACQALADLPGLSSVFFQEAGGEKAEAVALPTSVTRAAGALVMRASELGLLSRIYCSFHNERGAFGSAWFLDLPRLEVSNPKSGQLEYTTLGNAKIAIRRFRYVTVFGENDVRFSRYLIDDESNRIVFVPETTSPARDLYSDEERGLYTVEYVDGKKELFNLSGRLVERKLPDDVKIDYGYDDFGRLVKVELSDTQKTIYTVTLAYDDAGRVTSARSGGRTYQYTYDKNSDLTAVSGGVDSWSYTYTPNHFIAAVTHNGRKAASLTYDSLGRLLTECGADGCLITYRYTLSAGRTEVVSGSVKETYFPNGLMEKRINVDGSSVRYEYNDRGAVKLIEYLGPDQERSVVEYDNDSRYVKYTDAAGNARALLFDDLGRLRQVQEGKSAVLDVTYGRTEQGWLVAMETADSQAQQIYDDDRRLKEETIVSKTPEVGGLRLVCSYDSNGNIQRAAQTGLGTIELLYAGGVPQQVKIGKDTFTFSYASKRLSRVLGPVGEWSFAYGTSGNLESMTEKWGSALATYHFDKNGLKERLTAEGSHDVFRYNTAGRLTGINRNDEEQWEMKAEKARYSFIRNGTTIWELGFDEAGLLVRISH